MKNIRSIIFGDGEPVEAHPLLESKRPSGADPVAGLKSLKVPRNEARTRDTRAGDRHRLPDQKVTVRHKRRKHAVQLINLSGGGAMISGDFQPRMWDRLELHLADDGVIECAVRWIKDDRIGLEFAHETRIDCPPAKRSALLRDVIGRCFPNAEFDLAVPVAEPKAEPAPAADEYRRAEARHPLIWSGLAHFNHDSVPVRLRNISASGALIESSLVLPEGAELLLDLGEAGQMFAIVSWTLGDQAGLKFHSDFDVSQLALSRPEVAPAKWERPAYLREGQEADTPWAKEWGRLSLGELKSELDGFLKR